MKITLRGSVLLSVACLLVGGSRAQLVQKTTLSLATAKQVAVACESEALKNNSPVVIAIVDEGGNLINLERMDEAQIGSVEVAQAKAHSAIAFKRPTKSFQDSLAQGNLAVLKVPGTMASEGGVPLIFDGKIIGALGISGGTPQQDGMVAAAGASALGKILGK
jgi:glc operon protein GlcG